MKRSTSGSFYLLGLLSFIGIWKIISLMTVNRGFIFPGPDKTLLKTIEILQSGYIYRYILLSFKRLFLGFGISLVASLILGTISSEYPALRYFLKPFISFMKATPTASIIYLLLVLFGSHNAPVYLVFMICFPIVYETAYAGITDIEPVLLDALALEKIGVIKALFMIKLPLALPHLKSGLLSAFGLGLKAEIMAEVLLGYTNNGLGSAIFAANRLDPLDLSYTFAYTFIALILIFAVDYLIEKLTS